MAFCATPGIDPCIDREKKPEYQFSVTAEDNNGNGNGRKRTTTLTINILDMNDNRPAFLSNNYTGYILEETKVPNPPLIVSNTCNFTLMSVKCIFIT